MKKMRGGVWGGGGFKKMSFAKQCDDAIKGEPKSNDKKDGFLA